MTGKMLLWILMVKRMRKFWITFVALYVNLRKLFTVFIYCGICLIFFPSKNQLFYFVLSTGQCSKLRQLQNKLKSIQLILAMDVNKVVSVEYQDRFHVQRLSSYPNTCEGNIYSLREMTV